MPPILRNELTAISAARAEREQAELRLRQGESRLRELEAEQLRLSRTGVDPSALAAVAAQAERLRNELPDLAGRVGGLNGRIGEIIEGVLAARPPEELFEGLEGGVPVALLPVRLETRFFTVGGRRELRIRIFPDQIHIDAHVPELLPDELDAGRWYWRTRWGADAAAARAAWERLAQLSTPTRAAWIVRALTPTNLAQGGEGPVFPDPPRRAGGTARTPRATALPDRWVAVGMARSGGGLTPLFRKWGRSVPDALNVAPAFEPTAGEPPPEDELPVDAGLRWMTDYDEAVRVGMAITVDDRDLPAGRSLGGGLDLLVVLGVDWTLDPAQGAASLARLLHAHQYSDGLGFVPQGTPTNNTDTVRSGFTTDPAARAGEVDPASPPAVDPVHSASARLASGLGLPPGVADLSQAPGASLLEARTTALAVDTLWSSTLGYYLDDLLDPLARDEHIDMARDHAIKFLQPFGPYAALRVGKQPYGVLPVIASKLFKPRPAQGFEERLMRILHVLAWYWREGLGQVPRLGASPNVYDDLQALLQRRPLSAGKRYRHVVDPETVGNAKGYQAYAEIQSDLLRALVLPQLASVTSPLFNGGKITRMTVAPTNRPLLGPWVQEGDLPEGEPLKSNYIATIAQATRGGSAGRATLNKTTDSRILLEALLALAALQELDNTSGRVINKHLLDVGAIKVTPAKASLQVRTMIGVYTPQQPAPQGQAAIETPEQQARAVIPALTGGLAVADFVARQSLLPGVARPELRNLATFLASLDALAARPAAEIDRAFRGVLDCYSYRLDAWFTSVASRRLADMRRQRPTGLHLGGYGWVENLRPDRTPDSLGYVHAPSLAHAATAAIMRSGHLSHKGGADSGASVPPGSPRAALNIDLSSERVRLALGIIDGVAQGQPLAAILGYRFERGLRDRDIRLAQFIQPIRKLAPLRPAGPAGGAAPTESIAARDVVDGVALLDRWRKGPGQLLAAIKDPAPSAAQAQQIEAELQRLDQMLDAVSDVLISESVFQTVLGNYERAGAALAALDRQERPPEPQVVRTPRSGLLFQQRVALVLQADDPPEAWAVFPRDPRARAEPRLNAWVAGLLGDPARVRLAARVLREGGAVIESLSAGLDELGLSPLSLVLASVAASGQMPAELELRLAALLASRVADPDPTTAIELLDEPADAGAVGLGALRALLQLLHTFITRRRPLDARDLVPPEGPLPPGFDLGELRARLDAAVADLDSAALDLESAIILEAPAELRAALLKASAVGAPDAVPAELEDDAPALAALLDQARGVHALLAAARRKVQQAEEGLKLPPEGDASFEQRAAEHLVAQLRAIFGEAFPVLPRFTAANPAEIEASRADPALRGEPFAPLTWMQQLSPVRPELDGLTAVLTAAELLGSEPQPEDLGVLQLPHSPGQAWVALAPPEPPADPTLAIVTVGRYSALAPMAGLLCDSWSEVIPAAREVTGMSFHYDAPAARPPQAVTLAVPPEPGQQHWTFEQLLATVLETFDLAKLRAVGPRELPILGGGLLPMVFIPQDTSKQRPSINLKLIAEFYQARASTVLGKMDDDD